MKPIGFLLLLSGWLIVISAVVLLKSLSAQAAFVVSGMGVETLGLTFVVRSHLVSKRERE